jgi:hypothetical protein
LISVFAVSPSGGVVEPVHMELDVQPARSHLDEVCCGVDYRQSTLAAQDLGQSLARKP